MPYNAEIHAMQDKDIHNKQIVRRVERMIQDAFATAFFDAFDADVHAMQEADKSTTSWVFIQWRRAR